MAGTIDTAITNGLNTVGAGANAYKGTAAQRTAFLSTAVNGMLWQDTDGIKMIWRKDGAVWVPAVWRWSGTTAQMTAFTQAPNGFEWFNTTDNSEYVRLGGVWTQGLFACHLTALQPITGSWTLLSGFTTDIPLSGVVVSGSTVTLGRAGLIQVTYTGRHSGNASGIVSAALTRNSTSNPDLVNSISLVSATANTTSETKIVSVTAGTVLRMWLASTGVSADTMTGLSLRYI